MGERKLDTQDMKNVFIIGSKGIPANYGGLETFVEKLTEYSGTGDIQYYVSSIEPLHRNGKTVERYIHNGAKCFVLGVPDVGAVRAPLYDWKSIRFFTKYIEKKHMENAVVYVLACRIGPVFGHYVRKLHGMGVKVALNPDGHEWLRAKWNAPVKKYWRISERLMVKHSDFIICDSVNIEEYIRKNYAQYHPKTTFIAYGAETEPSKLGDDDRKFTDWLAKWGLSPGGYFVNIGRIVPENNYETMIKGFMQSGSKRSLVLVARKNPFSEELKGITGYGSDPRIKFVDGIYDQELLKKVRENAYGYIHGHSVGGTNPSLVEALAVCDLCLLYDVGFNREVGEDGALYWPKDPQALAELIDRSERMTGEEIRGLGRKAKARMKEYYSWEYIVGRYGEEFRKL